MDRYSTARALVILMILSAFIPLLPGDPKNPLGMGGVQRAVELNRALFAHPFGSPESRALTRFKGFRSVDRVRQFMDSVEKVLAEAYAEGRPEDVKVQVRGILRNEAWELAYDLYPVRIIGRFKDEGGLSKDPVLPEADWTFTQRKGYVELEEVP